MSSVDPNHGSLGSLDVWSSEITRWDGAPIREAAAAIESLGYSSLWIPGVSAVFEVAGAILAATTTLTVATGVLSVWGTSSDTVRTRFRAFERLYPGRLFIGLGAGHASLVNRSAPGTYAAPVAKLESFLDELDGDRGVPRDRRVLGALGPRMTRLAGARARGPLLYNTTVDQTATARDELGPDAVLTTEQAVVLTNDREQAHGLARDFLAPYLALDNYVRSWLRAGFSESDLAQGGSDRLVDAVIAWGDEERIAQRLTDHRAAGADRVAVQLLGATTVPDRHVAGWRTLSSMVR